ncbi:helix-turn-helix domain-containing protein [Pseudomonas viridiflava]|uniref:helix-turn-helix domain-containing protein n=1 Tax=Pseudomonas viridiflava TaxID=33069 RepID=UPI000F043B25|nr:XRE family transcriptional regulator [Pseudomonas viridiflava]MEE3923826.1 XRE family transcriptional regulator [Pseudomonas viridiflava]MEE3928862.1 XRE family transcriptional regulator [Pseudomonas viridiflava]MEE3939486.1 XRE family transcriptional regulator [Pseudomonas viridiflava]MEE3966966.1 XRE family transcriptional regulator [Pseudomonas viridiflava]MEE3981092.1 XRE family transcriptional regulator [Pseudomonas viridiflava]
MSIQLKILRKKMGITLEQLASQTDLTKSYLSKVERGLSSPSIAVALKLAKALKVQAEELFSDEPLPVEGYSLVRRQQRDAPTELTPHTHVPLARHIGHRALLPFMVYPPRSFTHSAFKEHLGEEFVYVHRGSVEVDFGSERLILEEGDALHFNAQKSHRIRTVSETQAELLVVVHSSE